MTMTSLIDQASFYAHYGDVDGQGRLQKVLAIFDDYLLKWKDYLDKAIEADDIAVMLNAIQGMRRFALLFHANKLVSLCDNLINSLSIEKIDRLLFDELAICINDTQCLVKEWAEQGLLHFEESSVVG